ncbi:DNA polymerase, partial [Paramuricea clavata]
LSNSQVFSAFVLRWIVLKWLIRLIDWIKLVGPKVSFSVHARRWLTTDSLCFIPMKLAAFPKTFGLTELQKGYFPPFFNRAENQDYVGPLPNLKFYDPDGMNTDDHENFYTWYIDLSKRQYEFDFQAEILRYCQSDVDILHHCCLELRKLFHQITDVDPFATCLTIASACNLVFRKTFLQENTITVIPPCGYKPENKQSVIALKMVAWVTQHNNIAIHHARNHGERQWLQR